MGGNAIKNKGLEARRIDTKELIETVSQIKEKVGNDFNWLEPVKFFEDKEDHGDIDLIGFADIASKEQDDKKRLPKWAESIIEKARSKGYHWNNPILSLEYNNIQIDITAQYTNREAKNHIEFCHYSPIGNVIGRMLKQTGAKWGIDGLTYPVRENISGEGEIIGTVQLSDSIDDVLKLAGLDPKQWHVGFPNEKVLYKYCSSSKYFNKEIFQFENLNHVNKKRDRLRKDYHSWLEYIKDKPNNYERYKSPEERAERKEKFFLELAKTFPNANLEKERLKIVKKLEEHRETAKKFNGNLVSEWTGLKDKELGEILKEYKNSINTNFKVYIEVTTTKKIKSDFLEFLKNRENINSI